MRKSKYNGETNLNTATIPVKRDVERKIKRALDPNGILAPGKSGIRI